MPYLGDLTYGERLIEMQLTTHEKRERGDLIKIYKLINNLKVTNGKYLTIKKKKRLDISGYKKKWKKEFA